MNKEYTNYVICIDIPANGVYHVAMVSSYDIDYEFVSPVDARVFYTNDEFDAVKLKSKTAARIIAADLSVALEKEYYVNTVFQESIDVTTIRRKAQLI